VCCSRTENASYQSKFCKVFVALARGVENPLVLCVCMCVCVCVRASACVRVCVRGGGRIKRALPYMAHSWRDHTWRNIYDAETKSIFIATFMNTFICKKIHMYSYICTSIPTCISTCIFIHTYILTCIFKSRNEIHIYSYI